MTPQEQAVITAARALRPAIEYGSRVGIEDACEAVCKAVDALETDGRQTIEWAHLAEGDELYHPKTKRWFVVERVRKMADGYHLTLTGAPKDIVRPTPAEPQAVVRRGATGSAVDVLVSGLETL